MKTLPDNQHEKSIKCLEKSTKKSQLPSFIPGILRTSARQTVRIASLRRSVASLGDNSICERESVFTPDSVTGPRDSLMSALGRRTERLGAKGLIGAAEERSSAVLRTLRRGEPFSVSTFSRMIPRLSGRGALCVRLGKTWESEGAAEEARWGRAVGACRSAAADTEAVRRGAQGGGQPALPEGARMASARVESQRTRWPPIRH